MNGDAWLDGEYRYSLTRGDWGPGEGKLLISMLNPSTADAKKNDPTLLRCIHFARLWGFAALEVVNPFALRSPRPQKLLAVSLEEAIGPHCDRAIDMALDSSTAYLLAWGNPPSTCPAIVARLKHVEQWAKMRARRLGLPVYCLGKTMHGYPKHPLARGAHRVPNHQQPILFV